MKFKFGRQIASLVVIVGCSLASPVFAQAPLRVAVDTPYAPFQYQHPDGSFDGFEVKLVDAICEHMNRKCEWVKQPWDGIIPGLMARKYDFIASALSMTPDREKVIKFAEPYYVVPSSWVAPSDSKLDPLHDKLDNVSIGVQRGTVQDDYVTRMYPNADIRRYPDADAVANDMDAGRLQLVFITTQLAQDVIIKNGRAHLVGDSIRKPAEIFGQGVAAGFRPRDTALIGDFNKALKRVVDDGTYEKLMKQFFNYDISPDNLK